MKNQIKFEILLSAICGHCGTHHRYVPEGATITPEAFFWPCGPGCENTMFVPLEFAMTPQAQKSVRFSLAMAMLKAENQAVSLKLDIEDAKKRAA